jgi:hypothetical protein
MGELGSIGVARIQDRRRIRMLPNKAIANTKAWGCVNARPTELTGFYKPRCNREDKNEL